MKIVKLNFDNTIQLSKILYTNNALGYIVLAYDNFNKSDKGKIEEFISLIPKLNKFLEIIGRDMRRIYKLDFIYVYVVEKTNRDVLAVTIWNNLKANESIIIRYRKLWSSIITDGKDELLDYFHYSLYPFSNKAEFEGHAFRWLLGRDVNPLYLGASKELSFFIDVNNNQDDDE